MSSVYMSLERDIYTVVSLYLFNLYNETIPMDIDTLPGHIIGGRNLKHIRQADGIVLMADKKEDDSTFYTRY